MTDQLLAASTLDVGGCRNLVAAVLWRAMYEAGARNVKAALWLGSEDAAHLADMIGINEWPPSPAAIKRVRLQRGNIRHGNGRKDQQHGY